MNNREPMFAGSFYPAEKKVLEKTVKDFLKKNVCEKIVGRVRAIIVPHAGYAYSGLVAAKAYSLLEQKKVSQKFEKIVLLGPSHQEYFVGAKTFDNDWEIPLGIVRVIPASLNLMVNDFEHSLEVQLPFLQVVLKKFFLTPIIYSDIVPNDLLKVIPENDLIVVSSDLSHFLDYSSAKKKDLLTIQKVLDLDYNGLSELGDACGLTGLLTIVLLAKKKNWKPVLLDYKNSGDVINDKKGVVGYASIVFVE